MNASGNPSEAGKTLIVVNDGLHLLNLLFPLMPLLGLTLGGYRPNHALNILEASYIRVVPLPLIPGLIGLIKAMSAQTFRYPLIGSKDA